MTGQKEIEVLVQKSNKLIKNATENITKKEGMDDLKLWIKTQKILYTMYARP